MVNVKADAAELQLQFSPPSFFKMQTKNVLYKIGCPLAQSESAGMLAIDHLTQISLTL